WAPSCWRYSTSRRPSSPSWSHPMASRRRSADLSVDSSWIASIGYTCSCFSTPGLASRRSLARWPRRFTRHSWCGWPPAVAVEDHEPLRQMREILSHGVHLRAFAVGAVLVMAGGLLIPFIAPSFIINVGLDPKLELPTTYMVGGLATALGTPLVGWLSDHID